MTMSPSRLRVCGEVSATCCTGGARTPFPCPPPCMDARLTTPCVAAPCGQYHDRTNSQSVITSACRAERLLSGCSSCHTRLAW